MAITLRITAGPLTSAEIPLSSLPPAAVAAALREFAEAELEQTPDSTNQEVLDAVAAFAVSRLRNYVRNRKQRLAREAAMNAADTLDPLEA